MSTLPRQTGRPPLVWVDGEPATQVDVLDRGLHYGDGLFETIACRGGQPRFLALHLARLGEGCARLAITLPDPAALAAQIRTLAALEPQGIVKLIVTRGSATARGYGASGDERSRCVLLLYPWPAEDPATWRSGVAVRTARARVGESPLLAGMKHLNRLEQVLIRGEWHDPDISESLLFSSSGWLVSGTMSNVFLVHDGGLMTPALTRAGVRGVMRQVVMREAQRLNLTVEEADIDVATLTAAQELFLTNARMGIWPVRALDGRVLPVGPVTLRLQAALRPLLESGDA